MINNNYCYYYETGIDEKIKIIISDKEECVNSLRIPQSVIVSNTPSVYMQCCLLLRRNPALLTYRNDLRDDLIFLVHKTHLRNVQDRFLKNMKNAMRNINLSTDIIE